MTCFNLETSKTFRLIGFKAAQDPRYICMHLFKEYARTATTEADGKRNIHNNIIQNVLCISNCTLLFPALCPVRWNVANCHNMFTF